MLEFCAEEGSNVWSCLRDDEVVDVEELGDTGEWGFSVSVAGVFPWTEGDVLSRGPGDDGAGLVFAFEEDWGVRCCGRCIGS